MEITGEGTYLVKKAGKIKKIEIRSITEKCYEMSSEGLIEWIEKDEFNIGHLVIEKLLSRP